MDQGRQAVAMTRPSCHRFRANEVRLWLSVIAYNLVNLWRRQRSPNWSLTSLQQRLVIDFYALITRVHLSRPPKCLLLLL
jgi:hypothetical protein